MKDEIGPEHLEFLTRRRLLARGAKIAAGTAAFTGIGSLLAACGSTTGSAPAASAGAASATGSAATASASSGSKGVVIVSSDGGAYAAAEKKAIYDPFTAATGIQVQAIPATAAQVLAMAESGSVQLDVLDTGASEALLLQGKDALAPIDYTKFKRTNPSDLEPGVQQKNMVGNIYFATVLGYATDAFPHGHPGSWTDFWNVAKFPGARTLEDIQAGGAPLEFALLADGVPMDKIYPIDLTRAFNSLSKIKKSVVKWWTTGAESTQLLQSGEAVAGGLWNGRVPGGNGYAIEWNQAMRMKQYWAIVKGAPHPENALALIDFALQPKPQADLAHYIAYGPTNKLAYQYISAADAAKLPSSPAHFSIGFDEDPAWWAANLTKVTSRWQSWLIQG